MVFRTSKTVNGVTTTYRLEGTKILSETTNNVTTQYIYDTNDSVIGFVYSGQTYYFDKNAQGDVIRIYNTSGTAICEYTYDAWGNFTATGNLTVAYANPFRYRSYYYDTESHLYYLQSRYYDDLTGRFLNADEFIYIFNNGLSMPSLFAYSNNNPVNYVDNEGNFAISFATIAVIAGLTILTIASVQTVISIINSPAFQRSLNQLCNNVYFSFYTIQKNLTNVFSRIKTIVSNQNLSGNYWAADLVNRNVQISSPLTFSQACNRVSMGKNVMCKDQSAALAIIFNNRYHNAVGPEKGCGNNFYWHYHPTRNHTGHSSVHIWFYT